MRQHRHPSLIRHLLPDHHVYVRSGSSSRYVVLAWPWQVGAGLAVVGLVLWTGLASYGWIAAHLESREQRREVARLAQVNQRLEAAYAPEQASAPPAAIARLVVDLEEIKAGQGLALRLAETAAADEPRPQPLPGEAGVAAGGKENGTIDDRLGARLVPAAIHVDDGRQGRDWLYDRLTRPLVDGPARTAEMTRLRAQLRAARAEIARLKGAPGESGDPALR